MTRNLPDWIEGFMEYTDSLESPTAFKLWTAISTVASALERKVKLMLGQLTFYPNMYIVLVGPPGCRKGTILTPAQDILDELNIRCAAETTTRESLIQQLAGSEVQMIDPITQMPNYHSSMTIFSHELTVFLGHNQHQLISDLTDWFDCRTRWRYKTKHQGNDDIQGVWVNLLGATTPQQLRENLSTNAIGGGLTSRIIFVYAEDLEKLVPFPVFTEKQRDLRNLLVSDLQQINSLQGAFDYTPEFKSNYSEWYIDSYNNPPFLDPRFSGYLQRRGMHLLKLSTIVSASRSDDLILTEKDLIRAKDYLEKVERTMLDAFTGVGKNRDADLIAEIILYIKQKGITTERELLNTFAHHLDRWKLTNIIETLSGRGVISAIIGNDGTKYKYKGR